MKIEFIYIIRSNIIERDDLLGHFLQHSDVLDEEAKKYVIFNDI